MTVEIIPIQALQNTREKLYQWSYIQLDFKKNCGYPEIDLGMFTRPLGKPG